MWLKINKKINPLSLELKGVKQVNSPGINTVLLYLNKNDQTNGNFAIKKIGKAISVIVF